MPTARMIRKMIERRRLTAMFGRSNGGVSQISSKASCKALAAASPAHRATMTPMTTVVQLPVRAVCESASSVPITGTCPSAPSTRSWRRWGLSSSTRLRAVTNTSSSGKMLKNDQ